jgi:Tol biopolymer transport system component
VKTTYRSGEELIGTVPPHVFETPATLAITVSTPSPGGGASNPGRLLVEVPPVVGRYIVFTSNRNGGRNHLFLYDRATTRLDPLDEANNPTANDAYPSISADGRFIVFQSDRHRGQYDIFLFDRQTRTLDLLPEANHPTAFDGFPKISPDGRLVVFESDRLHKRPKIFLFDRQTRTVSELSHANEATADDGLAAISN